MGVNANRHAREHRLCCSQPDWPIQIQWDRLFAPTFGREFEFKWKYNNAGYTLLNLWGLQIWIRRRSFGTMAERDRLRPFRDARWAKQLAREKMEYESSRL